MPNSTEAVFTNKTGIKSVMVILFVFISLFGAAQKPVLKFTFQGIGDNREFHNGQSQSRTIFGTLGNAEIGTTVNGNSLFAGISELYEFGSKIDFNKPDLILYYKFENPKKSFIFGSFPRRGTIDFPLAMLADTLLYYRPLIEGMSGKISWEGGHQLAFVDWTGRQTNTIHESFMAGMSGEINLKNCFFQNYFLLNHFAHTAGKADGQHIKDHFGFSMMIGFRFGSGKTLNGFMKSGILTSLYRERSVTEGFVKANSLVLEGFGQYRNFALKTTLHHGQSHYFALGDPLYRFNDYLRADAVWNFINFKKVQGRFNWSFHVINWKNLDHSQQLSLIYSL